jgi:hypothetical protein
MMGGATSVALLDLFGVGGHAWAPALAENEVELPGSQRPSTPRPS